MGALSDPDARYRGWARQSMHIVHDVREAYGWAPAAVRRFRPSARDVSQSELVEPWLAWLKREHGGQAWRRLLAWAMGAPLWAIGQRERCSDRTVMNRIDQSVRAIVLEFAGVDVPVEYLTEPLNGCVYAFIMEPVHASAAGGEIRHMRIYIGGRGVWRAGRWLRNERNEHLQKVGRGCPASAD
jgi:hypothetical protein